MIYKVYCSDKISHKNKECDGVKCNNWDAESKYCRLNKMQAVNAMYLGIQAIDIQNNITNQINTNIQKDLEKQILESLYIPKRYFK